MKAEYPALRLRRGMWRRMVLCRLHRQRSKLLNQRRQSVYRAFVVCPVCVRRLQRGFRRDVWRRMAALYPRFVLKRLPVLLLTRPILLRGFGGEAPNTQTYRGRVR